MKIAAEIYSVIFDFNKAPSKTLAKLKEYGYDGVELYGDPKLSAKKVNQAISNSNLKLISYQLPWRLMQGNNLNRNIEYLKSIHCKNVVIPALGGPWEAGHKVSENTVDMWEKHAKRINDILKIFNKNGISLSYHTHDYDFNEKVENKKPSLQILLENMDRNVGIELDTGNCVQAFKKPEEEILKLKERVSLIHIKPFSKKRINSLHFGDPDDMNNWYKIIDAAKKAGVKWLIIENEFSEYKDQLLLMKDSIRRIKSYL